MSSGVTSPVRSFAVPFESHIRNSILLLIHATDKDVFTILQGF